MSQAAPKLAIPGVGPQLTQRLAKLGIHTPFDLLFHLPRDYQNRTETKPLNQIALGERVQIQGKIIHIEVRPGRKRSLICHINDDKGHLIARFFHFNRTQHQQLQQHPYIRCFGEVRAGYEFFEMIHPEYQLLDTLDSTDLTNELTPIYPITEGLTQNRLRAIILTVLKQADEAALPDYLAGKLNTHPTPLLSALRFVHHPPRDADTSALCAGTHPLQQRLIIEELVAHRLSLRKIRQQIQTTPAPCLPASTTKVATLLSQLPFALTHAQQRVWREITQDLSQSKAMLRLLQGDVGSGKTVIAELAALQATEAGYQVAVMAPTEILAEQHAHHFMQDLTPLGITVTALTSALSTSEKRKALNSIATGASQVVVGTHALFQNAVEFQRLGLVIIDEQHRFGVQQRYALQEKGRAQNCQPHQLIMTATPIPRTLAMTYYADLDVSTLDELPPGRTPVKTVLISGQRRDEVTARVAEACANGRQAYWVCPLIEESELLNCQSAEETAAVLRASLPQLRIGLIHGRIKTADKAEIMQAFKRGDLDLLVATTVIEVGVNVPNASLMVIENAERLGLSQLHQLRGRVGRGSTESFCVLMYQSPLSQTAQKRLQTLRETQDGFKIAECDLDIRGPGDVLGTRQTGLLSFKIAALPRDQALLSLAQSIADALLQEHSAVVEPLIQRWVGNREQYARV